MNSVIVIPARYGSTRFPGKPLANILGVSLLERTWRIASAVKNVSTVVIATDDNRIVDHATAFGAKVQLTSSHWSNGSERSLEAVELLKLSPDIIVNLQGDAVLTPPEVIGSLLDAFSRENSSKFDIATPCVQLTPSEYQQMLEQRKRGINSGTMVTFDTQGKALYFSRALIPNIRSFEKDAVPAYRHIGLYAFRYSALQKYITLSPSPLEKAEGLEQLRALEHGMPIKVVTVDYKGRTHWSVDHPEDIAIVEKIIGKEGELMPITN